MKPYFQYYSRCVLQSRAHWALLRLHGMRVSVSVVKVRPEWPYFKTIAGLSCKVGPIGLYFGSMACV